MKRSFPPFLTPPEDGIVHGGWRLESSETDEPLPNELEHWDYQKILRLAASVQIKRSLIMETCQLKPESHLVLLITAHSNHTRTERPIQSLQVPTEDSSELAVTIELPGAELGGRLTLTTQLVATEPKPLSDLAASESGSILWSVRHHTHLQGIGARFPTDASDFSDTHPWSANAGWQLEVDATYMEARFMSAVRLTLNTGQVAIRNLLSGVSDDGTRQLRRTLHWDVTRQLALIALRNEQVRALDFDPDATTLAGVLRNIIAAIWPNAAPEVLHQKLQNEPSRIELAIQHHCRLLP